MSIGTEGVDGPGDELRSTKTVENTFLHFQCFLPL